MKVRVIEFYLHESAGPQVHEDGKMAKCRDFTGRLVKGKL
jgi:hypothetical protein